MEIAQAYNTGILKPATDTVHAPSHYTAGGIECIEYIRAKLTTDELRGYYLGAIFEIC